MATLSITQFDFFGFNVISFPDELKKTSTSSTSSTFAVLNRDGYGAIRYEVRGTDFKYEDGNLVSGKITSAVGLVSDGVTFNKAVEFKGVTLDVAKVYSTPGYNPFLTASLNYDASTLPPDNSGYGVFINATDLADTLRGSVGSDTFNGFGGADTIFGGLGVDFLRGGGGNDRLYGGSDDDYMTGGIEAVAFDGGSGNDTVTYGGASAGLVANLANQALNAGVAKGDTYDSVENLSGGNNADKLTGNSAANKLIGWGGNDTLSGGSGNDTLVGLSGADKLIGGSDTDTAAYSTTLAGGVVLVNPGGGVRASLSNTSLNTGDAAGDTYSSIENLRGTNFDDKLYGDTDDNVLTGLSGKDTLSGASGDDVLVGGDGDDTLLGGNGEDRLIGGLGADDLTGGTSADEFVFDSVAESTPAAAGRDTIFDFSKAEADKIDLIDIDANTNLGGDQKFTFIGSSAFSNTAGQLRFDKASSDTHIYADINGDGVADFRLHLDDAVSLVGTDFLL